MFSDFLDDDVDLDRYFFPVDTSTKQTGLRVGCMSFFTKLTLSCLKPWVGFVNYIEAAPSSDHFAIGMTIF